MIDFSKHIKPRPVVVFDIEGTGTDVATARIVEFAAVRLADPAEGIAPWETPPELHFRCDPEVWMTDEVVAIHGIQNEDVHGLPTFGHFAPQILEFIKGADLAGYNLSNYDVPLLWEEFHRAGIEWSLDGVHVIDAGTLFKIREPRTLSAALRFYCHEEHTDAHAALSDVVATANVLRAQIERYSLGDASRKELAEASAMERRADLAGKIVYREKDGAPCYAFGKVKGTPVLEDRGFARWMLEKDFPEHTKRTLRKILGVA